MIRHQALSPDADLTGMALLGHQIDIGEVIIFLKKGLLATIVPLSAEVRRARGYDPCDSP